MVCFRTTLSGIKINFDDTTYYHIVKTFGLRQPLTVNLIDIQSISKHEESMKVKHSYMIFSKNLYKRCFLFKMFMPKMHRSQQYKIPEKKKQ